MDAIKELHTSFAKAGCTMVGAVSTEGYEHSESKVGCPGLLLLAALLAGEPACRCVPRPTHRPCPTPATPQAERDGMFMGRPLGEDTQDHLTDGRISAWTA